MDIELQLGAHLIAVNLGIEKHGIYLGSDTVLSFHVGSLHEQSVPSFFKGSEPWALLYTSPEYEGGESVRRARLRQTLDDNDCGLYDSGPEFATWCITGGRRVPADSMYLNLLDGTLYSNKRAPEVKDTSKSGPILSLGHFLTTDNVVSHLRRDQTVGELIRGFMESPMGNYYLPRSASETASESASESANEASKKKERFAIGAHLSTPRTFYSHHGIYVGNNQVVHYSGFSEFLKKGPISMTTLEDFAGGQSVVEVTYSDALHKGASAAKRAINRFNDQSLSKDDKHNLLFNNCEHFATWCITGKAKSKQVATAAKITAGGASVSVVAYSYAAKDAIRKVPTAALQIAVKQAAGAGAKSLLVPTATNALATAGIAGIAPAGTASSSLAASSLVAKGIAGAGAGGLGAAGVAGAMGTAGGGALTTAGLTAVGAVAAGTAAPFIAVGAAVGALIAIFW
jgi:hypothetical protein